MMKENEEGALQGPEEDTGYKPNQTISKAVK